MTKNFFIYQLIKKLIQPFRKKYILFDTFILPAAYLRFCGAEFKSDKYFLTSAQNQVEKLISQCELSTTSKLVDIGCGPCRLAIGILSKLKKLNYTRGLMLIKNQLIGVRNIYKKNIHF